MHHDSLLPWLGGYYNQRPEDLPVTVNQTANKNGR